MLNSELNPWTPISDKRQLRYLGKLLEELGELVAATSRCIIQGLNESEPVTGKFNIVWLTEELADVEACISATLEELNLPSSTKKDMQERFIFKKAKLLKWLDLATKT